MSLLRVELMPQTPQASFAQVPRQVLASKVRPLSCATQTLLVINLMRSITYDFKTTLGLIRLVLVGFVWLRLAFDELLSET